MELVVEATANVFYVFLPHGDAMRCVVRSSYMGKCKYSVVDCGVGVVKRRHVGGYRGASVTRELRGDFDRVASAFRASSASSVFKGSSSHPLPRTGIGARLYVIVELSGEVWLVFVLEWFVCGTVSSAYVDELKRARNSKEKANYVLSSHKSMLYLCRWQGEIFRTVWIS